MLKQIDSAVYSLRMEAIPARTVQIRDRIIAQVHTALSAELIPQDLEELLRFARPELAGCQNTGISDAGPLQQFRELSS